MAGNRGAFLRRLEAHAIFVDRRDELSSYRRSICALPASIAAARRHENNTTDKKQQYAQGRIQFYLRPPFSSRKTTRLHVF